MIVVFVPYQIYSSGFPIKGLVQNSLSQSKMTTLNPTPDTVQAIKDSIVATLQNHALPASARAAIIAPQLAIVNQWSDQIPLVLENSDAPATVNLVFAIRKDLYNAPQFIHCVLGIPATELPPAFSAFMSMILKLIEAQKTDKEKPPVKVCISTLFRLLYANFCYLSCVFSAQAHSARKV